MVSFKYGLRWVKRRSVSLTLLLVLIASLATWHLKPYLLGNLRGDYHVHDGADVAAIIILGGGVTPDGNAPAHTQERIKLALEVDKELSGKSVFFTLSGGTPHKPNPSDKRGFPVWESTAAAKALLSAGVPLERILEESFSLDTVGNVSLHSSAIIRFVLNVALIGMLSRLQAYFLRVVHVDPAGLRRMVVVTNDWHMPRTQAIFSHVFALPAVAGGTRPNYDIEYRAALSGIADPELLQVRKDKEAKALQAFVKDVAPAFRSLQEMHTWIFSRHGAYHTARLQKVAEQSEVSAELLKTY
jgi:uncharacterized SAM-binding protein YcdF (DUF218 family)